MVEQDDLFTAAHATKRSNLECRDLSGGGVRERAALLDGTHENAPVGASRKLNGDFGSASIDDDGVLGKKHVVRFDRTQVTAITARDVCHQLEHHGREEVGQKEFASRFWGRTG